MYSDVLDILKGKNSETTDVEFTYGLSDDVRQLLADNTGMSSDTFDRVKSISLGGTFAVDKGNSAIELFGKLNEDKLVSANIAATADTLFLSIPELSDRVYGVEAKNWLDSIYGDNFYNETMIETMDKITEALKNPDKVLSPSELEDMIVRYSDVIYGSLKNVSLEKSEKVTVGKVTQKFNVLSVDLNGKTLERVLNAVFTEMSEDKVIEDIIVNRLGLASKQDYRTSSAMLPSLTRLMGIRDMDIDGEFNIYVDTKGVIKGVKLVIDAEEEKVTVNAVDVADGRDFASEYSFEVFDTDYEEVTASAKIEIKGSQSKNKAYTGVISFEAVEEDEIVAECEIKFTDLKCENEDRGYYSGTVEAVIPDVGNFKLDLISDGKSQTLSYSLSADGFDYGTFTLTYSTKDSASVTMPIDPIMIDVNGDFDISEYITEERLNEFVYNILIKCGFDEDMAAEGANGFTRSIFQGYSTGLSSAGGDMSEYDNGYSDGYDRGYDDGYYDGKYNENWYDDSSYYDSNGYAEGYELGYAKGYSEGYAKGIAEGDMNEYEFADSIDDFDYNALQEAVTAEANL